MPVFESAAFEQTLDSEVIDEVYAKVEQERKSALTGYYDLPYERDLLHTLKEYAHNSKSFKKVKTIAVIGIGGSTLGTKAVEGFLRHTQKQNRELVFFENSDPVDIWSKLEPLKKKNTLVIVVSKSGSTIETISIFKAVATHLELDFDKDSDRVIAVTDRRSVLEDFALEYGIRTFLIDKNVGGRFSVLSAVGIVPLYLAGYDVEALLDGAQRQMDLFFAKESHHLLQKAHFYVQNAHRYHTNVVFAYSSQLEQFVKWYIQIWGESLGKIDAAGEGVGPTPVGLTGSVDQHSFLQLLVEGPKDKTVTFIAVEDFGQPLQVPQLRLQHLEKTDYINGESFQTLINAQCEATKRSLDELRLPTDKITLDRIDAEQMGALMTYYELLTSIMGILMKINTYNQPGVETGKKILRQMF